MEKTYGPNSIEDRWYKHWEASGAFAPSGDTSKEAYTIIMPPPNVTGSLHMGHALDVTLQDVLIRFERLRGKNVLWQPGTDHAGIATQMVVERMLDAEGKDRRYMGREAFLERVWQWKAESGGKITQQLRRLGASCDWENEAFTMDEPRAKAVTKKFVELFEKGLIYRDKRLVNWDPKLRTAISDLEVEQKEVDGHFWHFRYPLEDGSGFISIATTRPETILGDGAVAVHPDDERYKHLVGKRCKLPIVDRLIPIIADDYVQMDFGSGAVKITAAHDYNDYDVYKRHPDAGIPLINLMNADATMSDACPEDYRGLDRYDARKKVVADFEALGLLDKIEPHKHMVPYGDRGGVVIEPWLTDQWYVDAETLAKPAIEAVETGKTKFTPKNWEKTYFEWMRNIQPWCVSRQLWWGHRIPAWYDDDQNVYVAETEDEAFAKAREKTGRADVELTRDEDVLDTWFSSAMWPYSTLGWPEENDRLKAHYPTATLVTGFDIIFFWVARMMMSGIAFMDEVPFKDVYIHALVRDENGQKMSKSKGNVIDPLEFIEQYGADALRFTLAAMEAQGRDIKLSESRVAGYRNFGTKLWNAARFCEMNGITGGTSLPDGDLAPVNAWIVDETAKAAARVTAALEAFRYNEAADAIYHFTWGTFCDWYIELIKPTLNGEDEAARAEAVSVAGFVLDQILTLLHPFMPFITEELWHALGANREHDLIAHAWPTLKPKTAGEGTTEAINDLITLIGEVRSARTESNIPASAKLTMLISGEKASVTCDQLSPFAAELDRLARVEAVRQVADSDIPRASIRFVLDGVDYALPLEGVLDLEAEAARLTKVIEKCTKEIGGLKGRLGNEKFLAKAPEAVVADAKAQLAELEEKLTKAEAAKARLG